LIVAATVGYGDDCPVYTLRYKADTNLTEKCSNKRRFAATDWSRNADQLSLQTFIILLL